MTNTSLAIQKAVEGGWKSRNTINGTMIKKSTVAAELIVNGTMSMAWFLDPTFWQALGKTEGWSGKICRLCGEQWSFNYEMNLCTSKEANLLPAVMYYWHRLLDAIQQGRSIDEFFGEILKK